jgi:hypothetical protein
MKLIVFSLCIVAAACSPGLDSPISPSLSTAGLARAGVSDAPAMSAQYGSDLPFHGSFSGETSGVVNCPPTCPPTTLTVSGSKEGTATHLGRFSAAIVERVDIATATGTGTIDFTAANGDHLFATTVGEEEGFVPPNISSIRQLATVTGGSGRFAGATGSFTVRLAQIIDFPSGTATLSGSFDGLINWDK